MGTIDIKNFPAHVVSDDDTFLMTDAKNGFGPGSITVKTMKDRLVSPLIETLSLNYVLLTQAEYNSIGIKKDGTFYIIRENGKLVKTYIGTLPLTKGETLFRVFENSWQVSGDGGRTWEYILDDTGRKIKATGDKGDPGNPAVLRRLGDDIQFLNNGVWEDLYYIPDFVSSVEVVNETGQSLGAAVSQKLFTDTTVDSLKYQITTQDEYTHLEMKKSNTLYCCVDDGRITSAYIGTQPFLLSTPPVFGGFPYTLPFVLS